MKIVTYANRIAYTQSINRVASNSNVNVWERDFRENSLILAESGHCICAIRYDATANQIIDENGLGKPIFPSTLILRFFLQFSSTISTTETMPKSPLINNNSLLFRKFN